MRKILMAASAAAIAISMPALAKPDKEGKGGGGKPEHAQKADKGHGGGGGHKNDFKEAKFDKPEKAERGWAKQEMKAEKQFRKEERKADKNWAKNEEKAQKQFRKSGEKAEKRFAKREERLREDDRRFREDLRDSDRRFEDRDRRFEDGDRRFEDGDRRFANMDGCPPGLAKKNNGCLPPGQAKKLGLGERLPEQYFQSYNIPARYQDWYQDGGDYAYRYGDGNIYRVEQGSNLISGLIPLLGGAFGIGNLLPTGFDAYNLPTQYRDDYVDSDEAMYRYGDNAIYQVDPKTSVIESVVALLAGNMNVGQVLPAGYDAYNLPMQYRDQYVDSDEAMYRYADNNIYQIDPKTQIIEQIVAMLT